jgi:hypothetical protein
MGALHAAHARHDANGGARFLPSEPTHPLDPNPPLKSQRPHKLPAIAFARSEIELGSKIVPPLRSRRDLVGAC